MKKILCLILILVLSIAFVGCGNDANQTNGNVSGEGADAVTIEIVNNAYAATKKAIKDSTAMGFDCSLKITATLDEQTVANRIGTKVSYLTVGNDKLVASEMVIKSGDENTTVLIYDDTKNVYGVKAGTTYILSDNDDTKKYVNSLTDLVQFFDASKRKVLETVIVNADGGGYGFVLEYAVDEDNSELKNLFGEEIYDALEQLGAKITVTGLRVSGIIDSEGKMISETVTYSYTYPVEVKVDADEVDPNNPEASLENGKTETKTTKAEIVMQMNYDYDLTEITAPDGVTVIPENAPEDYKKPTLISLADFSKLSDKGVN